MHIEHIGLLFHLQLAFSLHGLLQQGLGLRCLLTFQPQGLLVLQLCFLGDHMGTLRYGIRRRWR
jgi:hypothetical protein